MSADQTGGEFQERLDDAESSGGSFSLGRPGPAPRSRGAQQLRWMVRALLAVAIAVIAWQRGMAGRQVIGVGLAMLWALALPFLLRLVWRATAAWQRPARLGTLAVASIVLLVAFAFGVRPLLNL